MSCSENHTGHLCKYDQTAWLEGPADSSSTTNLRKEIFNLRSRITTLKQTTGLGCQLLSFNTSTNRKDLVLHADENSINRSVNKNVLFWTYIDYVSYDNDKYTPKLFSEYTDQLRKFKLKNMFLEVQDDRIFNEGFVRDSCVQREAVIEYFPELPSLKIVNALVQRFFKVCYKFALFFDEKIFMNDICLIFKSKQHVSQDDIAYKRSTISILLTMLRHSYLTLPLKGHHNNLFLVSDRDLVQQILRYSDHFYCKSYWTLFSSKLV